MNPRIRAWLDQDHARLVTVIRRHGWAIHYVGGEACSMAGCRSGPSDEPPFAYTVGLFGLGHPELLIFDVGPEIAVAVLNELGGRVLSGGALLEGLLVEVETWDRRFIPEAVPNPEEIVFVANDFYQQPPGLSVPVLQLSYDDGAGRFPWEQGCRTRTRQPRPGTFQA